MPKNTKFLIVQLLDGQGDRIIHTGSVNLRTRLLSKNNEAVETPDDDGAGLLTANVGDDIRAKGWFDETCEEVGEAGVIYLRGHGNWRASTLGGRDATSIAKMLRKIPSGAKVNIVGCNLAVGHDEENADNLLGTVSLRSFAGNLHRLLEEKQTSVVARSQPVQVNPDGRKVTYEDRDLDMDTSDVRERMKMMLSRESKRADSKWRFYWDGKTQKFDKVY